jgi:hypothetical protein
MSQTAIDIDAMRRALAMQGHLVYLGKTETSCVLQFAHRDGRVYISHRANEADCIKDIEQQTEGIML